MISGAFMMPHYGWRISEEGRGSGRSPEVFVVLVVPTRAAGRPGRCRPKVASRPGPGQRGPLGGRLDPQEVNSATRRPGPRSTEVSGQAAHGHLAVGRGRCVPTARPRSRPVRASARTRRARRAGKAEARCSFPDPSMAWTASRSADRPRLGQRPQQPSTRGQSRRSGRRHVRADKVTPELVQPPVRLSVVRVVAPHDPLHEGNRLVSGQFRRQVAHLRPHANGTPMARATAAAWETSKALAGTRVLTRAFVVERVTGIEPALSAWEADVLPLNYTRRRHHCT